MSTLWEKVAHDFSDLPSAADAIRVAIRLLIAALLGGFLGFERQKSGKAAGLRTHMLVALGAALFVLVPQQLGMTDEAVSRVLQGLVAGVGFLGAGAILKVSEEGEIRGLTTAATVWLTAAIGVATGLGREATAVLGTVLALIILSALQHIERRFFGDDRQPPDRSKAAGGTESFTKA